MIWASIVSGVTTIASKLFGFKTEQVETVQKALDSLGSVAQSDADYNKAAATAIAALYQNGNILERSWRPATMWAILILIVCDTFGWVPAGITPEKFQTYMNFFEMGFIGYMPLRSIDKWMKGFQIGALLKTVIEKKVL